MDELIKGSLTQGEEILWSGKPADFQPMDKTHKSYYIRRSIIVAVVSAALLAAYFYSASATGAGIKWGVVAVLLAVAVYSLVAPIFDIKRLRSCSYVLTNENLFLVTPSDVRSVKLSSIPTARLAKDEDGLSSLLCGPLADKLPAFKRRVATLSGALVDQDSSMCDRFVLYGIGDTESLKKAAEGYLTIA